MNMTKEIKRENKVFMVTKAERRPITKLSKEGMRHFYNMKLL